MDKRFRSKAACRIAEVDRLQHNDAIAKGNYPCAPETVRGASRLYDLIDLIALFVFGREIRRRQQPSLAGELACQVSRLLRNRSEKNESLDVKLAIFTTLDGLQSVDYAVGENGHDLGELERHYSPWYDYRVTNISDIRQYILDNISDEMSIVGEEDG